MKKLLMIAALATTAMAMPPDLKPPITTGGTGNTSSTEVRITANVVQGIAVNEASPIDFGNLARNMYEGTVSQNIPGRVHVKGEANKPIKLSLNTTTTNLTWTGENGTKDTTNAQKATIDNVKVYGLTVADTPFTLDKKGELTQILTASFIAVKGTTGNLSNEQKLGSYVGSVTVTATAD